MSDAPAMHEVLGADAPSNWGKWRNPLAIR